MKKNKRTIVLNLNDFDVLRMLEDEQLGRLFRALYQHYCGEKYTVESDIEWPFRWVRSEIDRYNKNYEVVCEKRSDAGTKGSWRRWKDQAMANVTNVTNVTKVADLDNEMDNEMGNEKAEIKKIFLFEKGIFAVNREYERFCAHYEKNGWLDGNGTPIINRIACAKCWAPIYKDDIEKNNSLGFAKCWKSLYDLLASKEGNELLVTDVYRICYRHNKVCVDISRSLYDFLRTNYDNNVEAVLKSFGLPIEWNVNEPK